MGTKKKRTAKEDKQRTGREEDYPRMKQRFSSLDVKVISLELNAALTGLRVSNIYDLSSVRTSLVNLRLLGLRSLTCPRLTSASSSSNSPNRTIANSSLSTPVFDVISPSIRAPPRARPPAS